MKNFIRFGLIFLAMETMVSCSSQSILVEDKPLEKPINFQGEEKLGFRGDQVVFQKRISLEQRLHSLDSHIFDLQTTNSHLWENVKDCKTRLADVRIGGNGTAPKIQPWQEKIESAPDYKYVHDTQKNSIFAVSEEELGARIQRFEKYDSYLEALQKELREKNEQCNMEYSTALSNHGMNVADTQAQGSWIDGQWKMTTNPTYDPEELARRKAQRDEQ